MTNPADWSRIRVTVFEGSRDDEGAVVSWFESRRATEDADPFTQDMHIDTTDGQRTPHGAGPLIQINEPYERMHHPDWFDGDVFQLDSEGVWQYRPAEGRYPTLRPGFTAYERITT